MPALDARAAEFVRFANLFASALLLVDAAGRIHAANSAARRRLLGSASEIAEQPLETFVADPPDKVHEYLRLCARSTRRLPGSLTFPESEQSEPWHCEGAAYGGREAGVALVLLNILPKHESVHRFVALNQRIGELRHEVARRVSAERTAREQQELLHVTLASIGDGVITTDAGGEITFMNAVATRLTGWGAEEAEGMPLENVFVIRNEKTGAPVDSPVRKVLREGMVVGLANHTVLIRKDGAQVPIDDSGAPIKNREGRLFGVVLVFHEITERRRMERELMHQAEALREADRRKDEFLAMLAHELRNPLASLHNVARLLKLEGPEADVERLADIMDRQTVQLTRLVDDLLDVARITRGTIRLEREPLALARVIDHAVESVRPLMDDKRHRLRVRPPAENVIVDGDLARLSQVFGNLLSNAAKFTPPAGDVELTAMAEAGRVYISVRDTGQGMEPELLTRVFDLFTQGTRSLERSEGGLGIGLTLVKTLVDMHGGEVSVHSEGRGKGSEFVVSLPVAESIRSAPEPGPEPGPGAERAALETRVLVVDDNSDAAESLSTLLDALGCATRIALDGPSAIESARLEPPDVVLLDIGLPGMDGYEVARRLRRLPAMTATRIVAVSGYSRGFGTDGDADAFDDHLTKPVDPATLRGVIALDGGE